MRISSEDLSKEIAREVAKLILPRVRKIVKEEIERANSIIVETQEPEIPARKDNFEIRNKIRKSIKTGDNFYDNLIESAGDFDTKNTTAIVDNRTLSMAGKLTVEQMEKKAKEGEYVDPSSADYSSLLGDL